MVTGDAVKPWFHGFHGFMVSPSFFFTNNHHGLANLCRNSSITPKLRGPDDGTRQARQGRRPDHEAWFPRKPWHPVKMFPYTNPLNVKIG